MTIITKNKIKYIISVKSKLLLTMLFIIVILYMSAIGNNLEKIDKQIVDSLK